MKISSNILEDEDFKVNVEIKYKHIEITKIWDEIMKMYRFKKDLNFLFFFIFLF